VQLTITQSLRLAGAVIVTTRQTLSLVDVARGPESFCSELPQATGAAKSESKRGRKRRLKTMATIKITSKRQATLPAELCRDIGIGPGDELVVEQKIVKGELVWILRPRESKLEWIGALRKYAQNKSHETEDIRRSIADAGKK